MAEQEPTPRQGLRADHRLRNRMDLHRLDPDLYPPQRKIMKSQPIISNQTLSGWALRYRLTTCGERQIVEVLLPGNIIGLQSLLLGLQNEGVSSLTRVSLCVLGGVAVGELFAHQPGLARGLVNSLLQDQNRADRQMTLDAKTSSASRLDHFLLEIFDRAGALGGQNQRWCHFPLQRGDLSDNLGISPTHVSRSTSELSKLGLATIPGNTLEIIDRQALVRFSGYQRKHAEVERLLL
ncbi:Crp/Fnr family transcriptional regulator [Tsuneonella suprasediminis]|uniref:Crp/Fnr family transcriptional regulator n=2 Tax=Tsuneonella suprasediminis TaxID=2306996 RepID=A0A419R510_9SPHN|nr:Crp/Fnr family transcriptional regulator [Tsuneonella suprasediminis]